MIVYLKRDLSKLIMDSIHVGGDGAETRVLGYLTFDHDELVVWYVFTRRISHCDLIGRLVVRVVMEGDVEKLGEGRRTGNKAHGVSVFFRLSCSPIAPTCILAIMQQTPLSF